MKRKILLAVTGLSPQVVTETLYALCVDRSVPWIPDEIHLITTEEGGKRAYLSLLDKKTGQFHAFCRDYPQAKRAIFNKKNIHLIEDVDKTVLNDIRTPEDNANAANSINALVQKLTAEDNSELHVSIAGGRKTMGFYLGYCLSLFARAQDKLSHVLVSEPFESLIDFYFPPKEGRVLHTRDGKPIHTDEARVMLAEIPFVRLRQLLPQEALALQQSFSDVVAATQSALEKPTLQINIKQKMLFCGGQEVKLTPQLFAWYLWFAERARKGKEPVRYNEADADEFLACYARVVGKNADDYEKTVKQFALDGGIAEAFFQQKCSKVNQALKKQLALKAKAYCIMVTGKRPQSRYRIDIDADVVQIE